MLYLTCETSLTHFFVQQRVLNMLFLSTKRPSTWRNAPSVYHFSPVKHLQRAIPTITRYDHTVCWLRKRPKDDLSSCKTSLNLSFFFATHLNTWSLPCKVLSTCSFPGKMSSECTFLAQCVLNMFLVCEMLHSMAILEYVSQHVVSFRQNALNV